MVKQENSLKSCRELSFTVCTLLIKSHCDSGDNYKGYIFIPETLIIDSSLYTEHPCVGKVGWESLHQIFLSVCEKCSWLEILHNKQIGPRL